MWEVFTAAVYDHANGVIEVMAWLHLDGELHLLSKAATWNLYQEGSNDIFASVTNAVANKRFHAAFGSIALPPDKVYFLETKITDGSDVIHTSGSAFVTLD